MKLACMVLFVLAVCSIAVMADQITEPFCYWSGTSPACQGSCNTGEFVASTSKYGDGKTCITGLKKYCCKMPPEWLAQLTHLSFVFASGNHGNNGGFQLAQQAQTGPY